MQLQADLGHISLSPTSLLGNQSSASLEGVFEELRLWDTHKTGNSPSDWRGRSRSAASGQELPVASPGFPMPFDCRDHILQEWEPPQPIYSTPLWQLEVASREKKARWLWRDSWWEAAALAQVASGALHQISLGQGTSSLNSYSSRPPWSVPSCAVHAMDEPAGLRIAAYTILVLSGEINTDFPS